jgi:hypothetical protein
MTLAFGQQHVSVDQELTDKNFALVEDFEKNQIFFSADTFDLANQSTEGGELIVFHRRDPDYLVFDIWLFGETGKIHATYWTDRDGNIKIVKRTNFKYNKPHYEKGYTATETTEYLSYTEGSVKRYSADKKELNDSMTNEKKVERETFFKDVTKDLKFVK